MGAAMAVHDVNLLIEVRNRVMREVDRQVGLTMVTYTGSGPPNGEIVCQGHGKIDHIFLAGRIN